MSLDLDDIDNIRFAVRMTAREKAEYEAFRRFQSAMTPEMWNALDDTSANIPAGFRHKLTDLVGARKSLDTLRQELQQS